MGRALNSDAKGPRIVFRHCQTIFKDIFKDFILKYALEHTINPEVFPILLFY